MSRAGLKGDTRRKVLWAFGILAALCPCSICGGGYFVVRSYFIGPAESLPKEIRLARQDGIPLEPNDLRPNPPVPDDRNAANIYGSFFPHLDKVESKHRGIRNAVSTFLTDTATDEQAAEVRQVLAESRESLDEILAATNRPYCDFRFHYEDGAKLLFPQFAQFKVAGSLLVARAHDLARQGHIAEAYDLLARVDALARHAGQPPVFIGKLVELSIRGMAMTEFSHLLELSADRPPLLAKAQATLDGFGPLTDLRPAFGGELVMGRIMIHQIHTLGDLQALTSESSGTGDGSQAGGGPKLPDWVTKGMDARLISRWRQAIEAMPANPAEWDKAYHVLQATDQAVEADDSMVGKVSQLLFPVLAQSARAVGHLDASRRIAATSIRLLQDRLTKGSLPATLPNYGAVSVDPFDGKPLRYRLNRDGFTIYSIDRDGVDNGGTAPVGGKQGDLVRTYKLRPKR
ncbi:MAG TPA: hypothetical protein VHE55_03065 [Fimbriimonadaceae bacterium]|nr:hypothetical protein [Fimbriimonadaceae bacterium]